MSEIRNQSGGVSIETEQMTVGGDMVARDKIIQEAPAPIALNLHQLPVPPRDFVGREQEIADILRDLDKGAIISGVHGMGGIGKTALALVIADRLKARYPDAQFFLDLRGASDKPMSPTEAMAHVVRAYYPTSKLPDDGTELQGLYCSVLEGKKALVLMDNAKDATQITPLLPPATCLLLITSRQHFAVSGLRSKDLNVLPPDKACELLISIADRIGKCADDIAKLCGYLPQALRAAASLIAATIDLDPADYLDRLRNEHTRLENIGVDPNTNVSVEASLNLSYASLSPDTQRVFGRLAVFPALFDAAAEEVVCEDTNHAHLSQLVKLSLVQYTPSPSKGEGRGEGRYNLHDLVRLFADARLSDDDRFAAQRRHAEHYMNVLRSANDLYLQGSESIARGLALFDQESPNIQAGQHWAASHAKDDDEAAQLCSGYPDAGVYVLNLRQHPRDWIRWLENALNAARQLKDRSAEGIHLGNLGLAYADLGETREAIEFYEQRIKIAREISAASRSEAERTAARRGEGNALGNLGNAYADLGETRKAIEFYEQQLKIVREIGDRRGEGNALGNLGVAYKDLGETRKAIEFFEQHVKIAREIGDRRGEGAALGNLGNAYYSLGETRKAIEFYEQQLKIVREIGDRRGEGNALGNLGVAYKNLGETRKAMEFYEQSLKIKREVGDRRGEGNALWNMSLALDKLIEREEAIACAEAALKIYEQIEDPHADMVRQQLAEWKAEQQIDSG